VIQAKAKGISKNLVTSLTRGQHHVSIQTLTMHVIDPNIPNLVFFLRALDLLARRRAFFFFFFTYYIKSLLHSIHTFI
jgi:hypothetical protein